MRKLIPQLALGLVYFMGVGAKAQSTADGTDKSQYNLFHPTPVDLLRPLETDETDHCLDAHTLDAGHLQIDGAFIDYYRYTETYFFSPYIKDDYTEDRYAWQPRFKLGLLDNLDFEAAPSFTSTTRRNQYTQSVPFVIQQTANFSQSSSGFGSIDVRGKLNLWGNDMGSTSFAVSPYLTVPSRGGRVLPGMDIPFGWRLPYGLYLKVDPEFYPIENSYRTVYFGYDEAASLYLSLGPRFETYCYLEGITSTVTGSSWYGYTGLGIIYKIGASVQFFSSMGFGLDPSSYDFNPRAGFVWRL